MMMMMMMMMMMVVNKEMTMVMIVARRTWRYSYAFFRAGALSDALGGVLSERLASPQLATSAAPACRVATAALKQWPNSTGSMGWTGPRKTSLDKRRVAWNLSLRATELWRFFLWGYPK